MTIPAPVLRRIEQAEAELAQLRSLVAGVLGRQPNSTGQRWVYLAKTKRVGESYPSSGNTFGLQFIDREFTPTEGTQAVTDHTRSATAQAVGRTLDGSYLAEGTVVCVIPTPPAAGSSGAGRWVIFTPGTSQQTEDGTPIFNQSGVTLEAYRVLDVVGSVDIGGTQHLIVSYPTGAFRRKRIVNGANAVPSYNGVGDVEDYTGRGYWRTEKSGPVAVGLDMTGISVGDELGCNNSRPTSLPGTLQQFCPGFEALGSSYTSGGFRYVEAIQRPIVTVFGKVRTEATQTAAGDVETDLEVWFRGSSSGHKMYRAGYTINGRLPFLNKEEKVRAGTWARGDWHSNYWELDPACDPDDKDTAQQGGGQGQEQQFIFQGLETSDSTDEQLQKVQQGII